MTPLIKDDKLDYQTFSSPGMIERQNEEAEDTGAEEEEEEECEEYGYEEGEDEIIERMDGHYYQ
jgi:hypothetical protein